MHARIAKLVMSKGLVDPPVRFWPVVEQEPISKTGHEIAGPHGLLGYKKPALHPSRQIRPKKVWCDLK